MHDATPYFCLGAALIHVLRTKLSTPGIIPLACSAMSRMTVVSGWLASLEWGMRTILGRTCSKEWIAGARWMLRSSSHIREKVPLGEDVTCSFALEWWSRRSFHIPKIVSVSRCKVIYHNVECSPAASCLVRVTVLYRLSSDGHDLTAACVAGSECK